MRLVHTVNPMGRFHAVSTRDAAAKARDGEEFFALNWLTTSTAEPVAEIQFADGAWMLAGRGDLELTFGASDTE